MLQVVIEVFTIKNFNVVKLDSKGRIIIPFHIRDYLGLKEGAELLVANNEKRELKIFPLLNGRTAEVKVMMNDVQGSLSKTLGLISKHKIDILMSTSRTIEKGRMAEWSAIIDTSNCKSLKRLENDLRSSDIIKKFEVEEK